MVGSAWTGRNADTATCVDTAKMGVWTASPGFWNWPGNSV